MGSEEGRAARSPRPPVTRCLPAEPGGELGDDPVTQHVRHVEDLNVDLVVGGDVGGVVALEPGDRLSEGQVEVVGRILEELVGT